MRTMAETPLLPAYTEPVTEKRWAIARFGKTLDTTRIILILGEDQRSFFYVVQGKQGGELRGLRKKDVFARCDTQEAAETAILRAKIAWDAHYEKVTSARKIMRDAEIARDDAWALALVGQMTRA